MTQIVYKGTCRATGKRRYAERVEVILAHARSRRRTNAYRCPHCHDWHPTSGPVREEHAL